MEMFPLGNHNIWICKTRSYQDRKHKFPKYKLDIKCVLSYFHSLDPGATYYLYEGHSTIKRLLIERDTHPGSWCPNLNVSYPSWCLSCGFNRPFHYSIMLVASIWYVIQSTATRVMCLLNLLTVKVGPLIWCIVIYESCWWIKHSASP